MESIRIPWNDWKVVRQLGKGSYGTVYEIERTMGSRVEKAAMKVIPIPPSNQIIEDAYSEGYDYESVLTICKSFYDDTLNEYKLMQSLRGHKNIVACEDIASLPMKDSIGWEVYIRMELLTPLLKYQSSTEIDEKEIIKLGKDICQALIVCESNNIVHRDVKPGNIFVDKYGNYKLGDFGVARILDHSTNATRVGTERFMAPEVINRKPYDKSVDIYSLGLVMYWLLNGRRMPFLTPNRIPTAKEQENAYYRRISGENLWLPQNGSLPLKKAVLKACSFDRDARYQSAQELLSALNEAEFLLSQMINQANSQPSSNAFRSIGEDETIGNSWNFEDATVGASFGSKSKSHNHASSSHLYEDKTVGPGWNNNESKDNNQKNKKYGSTDASGINRQESYQDYRSWYDDAKQQQYQNSSFRKTKRKPFNASKKSILIYLIIGLGVIATILIIGQKIYSNYFSHRSVTFGGIEWIILDKEGENTLLLSKDIIENGHYNSNYASTTWETCTLRYYLNNSWYESTFSDEEKAKIQTTNVVNLNNAQYNTSGGNTEDKVFLLSIDEADHFFSSDDKRVAKYYGQTVCWWLRSPGNNDRSAAYVGRNGFVYTFGYSVTTSSYGIRPALWVNLE